MDDLEEQSTTRPRTIKGRGRMPSEDMQGHNGQMEETPTQSVIQASNQIVQVVDKRGRVIVVGRITALQLYRLTKVMKETASNPASLDLAVIASSVREINGEPVVFPTSEAQLEFLFQRLDFDGLEAIGEAIKQLNPKDDNTTDAAKN